VTCCALAACPSPDSCGIAWCRGRGISSDSGGRQEAEEEEEGDGEEKHPALVYSTVVDVWQFRMRIHGFFFQYSTLKSLFSKNVISFSKLIKCHMSSF
jgi:hypothetical protein